MNLLFIFFLLQIQQSGSLITDSVMKEYLNYGAMGATVILSTIIALYLFRKTNKDDKYERNRMLNTIDEKDTLLTKKTDEKDILYQEIKDMQFQYHIKTYDLTLKQQELQEKTIEALKESSISIRKNTTMFERLFNKL